ncbi:hypothetical protein BGZ65_000439 [Modicella reniformis]|uniref:Uncharacterized protein n=1 Tax=Modicella reniformis TaxID=1440133 RepID=A0A9P6SUK0_9FUNG|nr:hypothetical protein BGZ65_000439 [Modicella reniformis]
MQLRDRTQSSVLSLYHQQKVVRTYRGSIAVYKTYHHFLTREQDFAGSPIDLSNRLAIRLRKIPLDVVARETPEDEDRGTNVPQQHQQADDNEDAKSDVKNGGDNGRPDI